MKPETATFIANLVGQARHAILAPPKGGQRPEAKAALDNIVEQVAQRLASETDEPLLIHEAHYDEAWKAVALWLWTQPVTDVSSTRHEQDDPNVLWSTIEERYPMLYSLDFCIARPGQAGGLGWQLRRDGWRSPTWILYGGKEKTFSSLSQAIVTLGEEIGPYQ